MFNMSTDSASAKAQQEAIAQQWGDNAERMQGGALLGDVDQVTERILAYVEAGAQEINIALRAPWSSDALDAYLDNVMPAIKKEVN